VALALVAAVGALAVVCGADTCPIALVRPRAPPAAPHFSVAEA
jgi:hypothetical protein